MPLAGKQVSPALFEHRVLTTGSPAKQAATAAKSCYCCCCCCRTASHLYLDTKMLHVACCALFTKCAPCPHYYAKRVALFTQKWPWLMMMIASQCHIVAEWQTFEPTWLPQPLRLLLLHLAKTAATCCQRLFICHWQLVVVITTSSSLCCVRVSVCLCGRVFVYSSRKTIARLSKYFAGNYWPSPLLLRNYMQST